MREPTQNYGFLATYFTKVLLELSGYVNCPVVSQVAYGLQQVGEARVLALRRLRASLAHEEGNGL